MNTASRGTLVLLLAFILLAGCNTRTPAAVSPDASPTATVTLPTIAIPTSTASSTPLEETSGTSVRVNDTLHRVFPEDFPEQVRRHGNSRVATVIAAFNAHGISQQNGALLLDFLYENEFRIPEEYSVIGFHAWGIAEYERLAASVANDEELLDSEGLAILNQFIPSAVAQIMAGSPGVSTLDEQQISQSAAIFFSDEKQAEFMRTLQTGIEPPVLTLDQQEILHRQYYFVKGDAASTQQKERLYEAARIILAREWRQAVAGHNPFATLEIDPPGEPDYKYAVEGTDAWDTWMDTQSNGGLRPDILDLVEWFESKTEELVNVFGSAAQLWIKGRNDYILSNGDFALALISALGNGEISQHTFNLLRNKINSTSP